MTAIPNSVPVRFDEREHLVAPGRIEAVRRLVEEQQARVVDERLGELDPLLHAGRVAADRAVALLVQADVAEDLGGPFAGRAAGQPGHPGHVADEVRRGQVGRQAVVLGHVADELADLDALADDVAIHDRGACPSVGGSSPRRILRSVLLPAPFAPTSPMIPGSRSSVSPSSATTPPGYRLVSPWSAMSGMPPKGTRRADGLVGSGSLSAGGSSRRRRRRWPGCPAASRRRSVR